MSPAFIGRLVRKVHFENPVSYLTYFQCHDHIFHDTGDLKFQEAAMDEGPEKQKVIIFTRQFEIHGHLHMYEGVRLTDYINETKSFIAVTDAEVNRKNGETILKTSFLNVHIDDVEIIVPENSLITTAS